MNLVVYVMHQEYSCMHDTRFPYAHIPPHTRTVSPSAVVRHLQRSLLQPRVEKAELWVQWHTRIRIWSSAAQGRASNNYVEICYEQAIQPPIQIFCVGNCSQFLCLHCVCQLYVPPSNYVYPLISSPSPTLGRPLWCAGSSADLHTQASYVLWL